MGALGVVGGGGESDDGLLVGRGGVRLERGAHVRADLVHVVRVERQGDGELLVDEPGAKGRAEEVEGDQTRILHVLTWGGSFPRT